MAEELITKLMPPQFGPDAISRPRLIRRMSRLEDRKATFLIAPAGYGKTTLMLQLTHACGIPIVWYRLDAYDNDLALFLQHLVAGVRQCFPRFLPEGVRVLSQKETSSATRSAATILINQLVAHVEGHMLIVLDGYEAITGPAVHLLTESLIQLLPRNVHMLIASRTDPPFSLSRDIISGQALVLNACDLRFSQAEIAEVLAQSGLSLSSENIPQLARTTGGWPAAMRLACVLAASGRTDSVSATVEGSFDPAIARERQTIYDYLESEVLHSLPGHIGRFLTATSVLDVLTPEDCDALLDRTDSRNILKSLEAQQLFIVPVSGEHKAWRYHDLFREFLLDRLDDERISLLGKAASIAVQTGRKGQAIDYLLSAGACDDAAKIIGEIGFDELHDGHWETVDRWLGALSIQHIADDPWLSLYRANIEARKGHPNEAETWTSRSRDGFEDAKDQAGMAEASLLEAKLLRYKGDYENSLRLLDDVRVNLEKSSRQDRFDLDLETAACLVMAGKLADSEAKIIHALSCTEVEQDNLAVAHLAEGLGVLHYLQGRYSESIQLFRRSAGAHPEQVLPHCFAQGFVSRIYSDRGQLDRALDHAGRTVKIAEEQGPIDALPYVYNHLACILTECGAFRQAEEHFEKALTCDADTFCHALNRICMARCLALEGRLSEAALEAESVPDEVSGQPLAYVLCSTIAASILAHIGEYVKARSMLEEAVSIMESWGASGPAICNAYGIMAAVLFAQGNTESAARYGRKHLELAAKMGYVQNLLTSSPHLYRPVLREGIESGTEVSFAQRIMARFGPSSLPLLKKIAAHPSPQVRRRSVTPLAEIGGFHAQRVIDQLSNDADPTVRNIASAATACAAMAEASPERFQTPPLRLLVMGPFRVFCYGQEITAGEWRSTKARDLLAYLAQIDEPVTASRILEDLWPDAERDKATASLHSTFYRLRQALGASARAASAPPTDFIRRGGKRYQLAPDVYLADRDRFEELSLHVPQTSTLTAEGIESLEEMVGLYRGDYLSDLDYAWVMPEQERLKQICHSARLRLARFYLEEKQYPKAVEHARALLQMNPLFEEVCCLLMKAYGGLDDRRAIQEEYRALAKAMAEELAIAPSRKTRELLYRLCGDVEAQLRQELAGTAEPPPPR